MQYAHPKRMPIPPSCGLFCPLPLPVTLVTSAFESYCCKSLLNAVKVKQRANTECASSSARSEVTITSTKQVRCTAKRFHKHTYLQNMKKKKNATKHPWIGLCSVGKTLSAHHRGPRLAGASRIDIHGVVVGSFFSHLKCSTGVYHEKFSPRNASLSSSPVPATTVVPIWFQRHPFIFIDATNKAGSTHVPHISRKYTDTT